MAIDAQQVAPQQPAQPVPAPQGPVQVQATAAAPTAPQAINALEDVIAREPAPPPLLFWGLVGFVILVVVACLVFCLVEYVIYDNTRASILGGLLGTYFAGWLTNTPQSMTRVSK